ncbi:MAG: outer membrane protein assembly factor BamA [candidate division Zixibacteria bacterium]|nr:outer membrane protein assembly factor BamA [candidate division Zixibacteria bacterium]
MKKNLLRRSLFLTSLILLVALLSPNSAAQTQQDYNIVEIVVEGNKIATASLITGVAALEPGMSLTPSLVSDIIRRLYGLGIFSDVSIEAEQVMGGLMVFIVVDELPRLSGIEFSGNKIIKSSKLQESLGLGIGGYVSPYLTHRGSQKITEMYADKGYFQAEIKSSLQYSTDSAEAILKYEIKEKSKVKVTEVIISGCQRVEPKRLVNKMRNRKRGFLKSSDFAQEKYAEDKEKVIAELHKRGFTDAYLISDSISIDTTSNLMTIYIDLYEGPLYYFGKLEITGTEKLPTGYLYSKMKFEESDIFDAEKYQESIVELYTAYQDIGHLHIQVIDEKKTRNDSIIDVSYEISEGLPSLINLVKIIGNTKTKDKVIRREISSLPDQVFNRTKLIRSVRDVMALNYFANAIPDLVDLPNGDVDVVFDIKEKQTGEIMAGAGYNSQDRLVGNVGMAIPNFRGIGQRLSFNIEFGSRRNSFSLSFTEPWLFDRPTLLGTDIFALNRRWFSDYTEGRRGSSLKLGRRLRWPDNYFRVFATYRLEETRFNDFDQNFVKNNSFKSVNIFNYLSDPADSLSNVVDTIINVGDPYPGSILQYNEAWNASSRFSFTIRRDSRNLPEFATAGADISYTFSQNGGFLGGFWEFQKHTISIAKFFPLIGKLALAARIQYNVITSPQGDDRILISERFTPGGTAFDGVVRGYSDGSLTPDSIVFSSDTTFLFNGKPGDSGLVAYDTTVAGGFETRVRGKYMLITNLELQFPLVERQIYALAFFDAGNSWLHKSDIKLPKTLYKSYGFGFRIAVPGIGTIGFDFGYPLDNLDGQEKKWRPHFQLGTTFR